MLARYAGEIEEKQKFIDGIVEDAENEEPRPHRAGDGARQPHPRPDRASCNKQVEAARGDAEISAAPARPAPPRSHGSVRAGPANPAAAANTAPPASTCIDMWRAGLGRPGGRERLELFNRAAAHQTTGDNPGLLPEQILGPVINFVDESRPLTAALGPRQLPGGSWSRPQVTQHTNVAAQGRGEDRARQPEDDDREGARSPPITYGGYVNVSRQDIDWTQPAIMDIVINDLAGYYAQVTEAALGAALVAAATAGTDLPATPTGADVSGALWAAAAARVRRRRRGRAG